MLAVVHQPLRHDPALAIAAAVLGSTDALSKKALADCGVLSVSLDREVEIWLGTDLRMFPASSPSSLKVLVVLEPSEVVQLFTDGFDLVLSWQAEHLAAVPAARFFVPATPWLLPAEWAAPPKEKTFGLGFLRGFKTTMEGHQLRHAIWDLRELLRERLPLEFVAGAGQHSGRVGREERNRQYLPMFVLVVENSRCCNYFTEKLLDALLSSCVPVYWGCPNIGDFFDATGILAVDGDADAVMEVCQRLTAEEYHQREDAVKRNFALATRYSADFGERLEEALQTALNEA